MRRLTACTLAPAALLATAILIALTPMTSNAAVATSDHAATGTTTAVPSSVWASDTLTAAEASTCAVTDAAITWGVKESLRSYISGTIANGEWVVSDGATYDTPYFGWTAGTGTLDRGSGTLGFDGSLRFTGHDGILDTTLTALEIAFDGSTTARVVFDVTGTTQDGVPVDEQAVDFATIDIAALSVVDGVAELVAAPVVLTEAGSTAFGTYPAGEEFDPIALTFTANDQCMPQPGTSAVERNLVILIAVVAIAVCIGVVYLVARRRGTLRVTDDTPEGSASQPLSPR